ncbi:MAG: hypothetical protein HYY21_08155 [Candidatus Tectomicrobia bacterium]|nr:hypothetical protein [Candidatus Tectomicrobia bacterium]
MAETIRTVDYYYVKSPDKPGEGGKLLSVFRDAGVNLLAVHAFPERRHVQVDLVPEDAAPFLKAARKAKLKISRKKKAFLVTGDDRIGVLAGILEKLGKANINVTAVTALCAGSGRFGAIFWIHWAKATDLRRAAKALGLTK